MRTVAFTAVGRRGEEGERAHRRSEGALGEVTMATESITHAVSAAVVKSLAESSAGSIVKQRFKTKPFLTKITFLRVKLNFQIVLIDRYIFLTKPQSHWNKRNIEIKLSQPDLCVGNS